MENSIKKTVIDTQHPAIKILKSILKNANSPSIQNLKPLRWEAAHLDDSNFITHDVISLIRYCINCGIDTLYAIDTFDLLDNKSITFAREFPITLTGINQALWGLSNKQSSTEIDAEWFFTMSCQVSFIFPMRTPLPFVLMRDGGGCSTILGPTNFIDFIVGRSKRIWWDGPPHDGLSVESQRTQRIPIPQGRSPDIQIPV